MKYEIAVKGTGQVHLEANCINDEFLVQEVRSLDVEGLFADGTYVLFRDGIETDPKFVLDKDAQVALAIAIMFKLERELLAGVKEGR